MMGGKNEVRSVRRGTVMVSGGEGSKVAATHVYTFDFFENGLSGIKVTRDVGGVREVLSCLPF